MAADRQRKQGASDRGADLIDTRFRGLREGCVGFLDPAAAAAVWCVAALRVPLRFK